MQRVFAERGEDKRDSVTNGLVPIAASSTPPCFLPYLCLILVALQTLLPPVSFLPLQAQALPFCLALPRTCSARSPKDLSGGSFFWPAATYVQKGTRLSEPGTSEFGPRISTNGDGSMLAVTDDNNKNVCVYSVTQETGSRTLVRVP